MTGLDALGPPQGDPDSDILARDAWQGGMMPVVRRRISIVESQQAESGTQLLGPIAAAGKGVLDANIQLMKGVRWLGTHVGMDFGMTDEQVPSNLYDLLPQDMKLRLASRIARSPEVFGMNTRKASEFTGGILPLMASGGSSLLAREGSKSLGGTAAKMFSAPGQALRVFSWPGHALGKALGQSPKIAAWTRTAQALPPLLGASTGFGLYNFLTAEGDVDDRVRAGAYGMLAGAALNVAGQAATALESQLLSKTLTASEGKAVAEMAANIRAGNLPSWKALSGMMKKGGARLASTLTEGTGFAFLNPEFTEALFDGDAQKALEAYVETLPAALLARTGRMDAWRDFRREAPETNTTELRREIMLRRQGGPQDPKPGQMSAEPGAVEAARASDPVAPVLDPLFQAGWDIPEVGVPKNSRSIVVEFPGQGQVTMTEADGTYTMEVPAEVFKTVRGLEAKTKTVRMEGAVAEEFARDLAAITMMRRMGGELQFGGREAWAGGPWIGEDGNLYSVGVDGQTYTKQLPVRANDQWAPTEARPVDVSAPPDTPALAEWQRLAHTLRQIASPNPGLDLLEASVTTAINGSPESRSVQELRSFFEQVDPQSLSELLTPQTMEPIGMLLGRLGSGHTTAERALGELQAALSAPAEEAVSGDPRASERGFVDTDVLQRAGEAVSDAITTSVDYMYETQAEVVRKANPTDTFSAEGRSILSRHRTIRGETQHQWREGSKAARQLGREWRNKMEDVGDGRGRIARWEQLADKRVEPEGDAEKAFVEHAQAASGALYNMARDAGMVRQRKVKGKTKWAPLPAKDSYVVQRFPGRHAQDVYASSTLRRAWFDLLEDLNPKSGITSAALEQMFLNREGKDQQVSDSDVDTALEHVRELQIVPHEFVHDGRTYEMRNSSLFDVMSKLIEQQASQIATAERWGQDLPEGARKEVLEGIKNEVATPQVQSVRRAMERQGVSARVGAWKESLAGQNLSGKQKAAAIKTAEQWVQSIQGGSAHELHPAAGALRSLTTAPRVFQTIKAPIWDLPEAFTVPALYLGVRRMLLAHRKFWKNPREAIIHAERIGAVSHKMHDLIFEEASGFSAKIVSFFGAHGDVTERGKAAVSAIAADIALDDWARGRATNSDAELLTEMRFEPREQIDLISGKADPELQNKFRNEMVQLATSRAEKGEGARVVDNPNVTATLWYLRWASKRMGSVVRRARDVFESADKNGVNSRKTARAMKRLIMQLGVFGGGGMIGSVLIAFATGLLRLEGVDGAVKRAMREVPDSLGDAASKLMEATYRQTIGGPTAQFIQASGDASSGRKVAGLTTLTHFLYSLWAAKEAANNGDALFPIAFMRNMGLIPLAADESRARPKIFDWVAAMWAGEEVSKRPEAIEDRDLVQEFMRSDGAERGVLGLTKSRGQFAPTKSAGFYSAMKDAMAQFYRGMENGGEDEAWSRAITHLERAMKENGLEGDNLAGWIRSQRHTHGLTPEQVVGLADYARDPDRMRRIFAHDDMLTEFAREVGKLKGEYASEWSTQVENYERMVALGGGDHTGMAEVAVRHAADQIAALKGLEGVDLSFIETLSPIVATSDRAMEDVFTGNKLRFLRGKDTASERSRYIRLFLMQRAAERAKSEIRDKAREEVK